MESVSVATRETIDLRAALLDAAARLIASEGVRALTLRRVQLADDLSRHRRIG